jgi:hypothetical protein
MNAGRVWTRALAACVAVALGAGLAPAAAPIDAAIDARIAQGAATLPARLTDAEYWKLATDISEPGGFFRITDNYTSNENEVGRLFTMLRDRGVQGGVYLGVGPEQNFSYIAAIRPAMAFIVDIRRQAAMQHLMFKAMFELSANRAEFLSILFSRATPTGVDPKADIQRIWEAFFAVPYDADLAAKNRQRVVDRLTRTHRFTLTADELVQLDNVISAFVMYGPGITTRGSAAGRGGGNNVTFADLTGWSTDASGKPQSFLSSDAHYQTIKALHDKNLIVPVSGDFGGPKAIRAIGEYLRARKATLTAFYVSNVEQYLFQDNKHQVFYDNVAALPLTEGSVFIRPYALRRAWSPDQALCAIQPFLRSASSGRVYTNNDALACIR